MNRCVHGMPGPASCIDCQYEGGLPAPRRSTTVGTPLRAQFDSRCSRCDEPVLKGDRIVKVEHLEDGDVVRTEWPHQECAP